MSDSWVCTPNCTPNSWATELPSSQLHILFDTSLIFTNLNYMVGYLLQTLEPQLMSTLWMVLSMTLAVAFVTLDACVLCMVSPLPACADSACLAVCVLTLSLTPSLFLSPLPLCPPTLTPPPTGRVSLTQGASLLVERLTLEDEGWFECRILLLNSKTDNFQNGTWTFVSITGAARQGFGRLRSRSFRCSSLALSLFRTATACG